MSSIQIPLLKPDSLYAQVEVYPDELPIETNEILDPLVAEYAPLQLWKAVAVSCWSLPVVYYYIIIEVYIQMDRLFEQLEYYRQGMHDQFLDVLTSVAEEIENADVKRIYKESGCYKDIVDIYGILAADAITSHSDDTAPAAVAYKSITTWLNQSETINKNNEYIYLISGFFRILTGMV